MFTTVSPSWAVWDAWSKGVKIKVTLGFCETMLAMLCGWDWRERKDGQAATV